MPICPSCGVDHAALVERYSKKKDTPALRRDLADQIAEQAVAMRHWWRVDPLSVAADEWHKLADLVDGYIALKGGKP